MDVTHPLHLFPVHSLFHSPQNTAGEEHIRDTFWHQLWQSEVKRCSLSSTPVVGFTWAPGDPELMFLHRRMDNCRMETTADMHLSQRRRRTWQCWGGEGPSLSHLESNYTADGQWLRFLCWLPSFISMHLISFLSVCRHVMNELLETERAYVEELLCVLQVGINSSLTLVQNPWTDSAVFTGLCIWDGQPSCASPHACSPAEQKGGSIWKHAWNLPLPQEVKLRHLSVNGGTVWQADGSVIASPHFILPCVAFN